MLLSCPSSASSAKTVPPSEFEASNAIDVAGILAASEQVTTVPPLATYPMSLANFTDKSTIYSDWAGFTAGAAFVFKADMDTDCDGLDYQCDGNADGQPLTNWGALSAFEVPFIVIPDMFLEANPAAIPDTNGNEVQVTGEASWLLARSCFPEDDLSGNRGHEAYDVTYILFTGEGAILPPEAVNENYITDFTKLRSMGEQLTTSLMANLGLVPSLSEAGEDHPQQEDAPTDQSVDTPAFTLAPSLPQPSSTDANWDLSSGGSVCRPRVVAPKLAALFVAALVLVVA
ncbi:fungal chitosanase of glycosyl hydrolase group 75-domain-containing protein [Aspergillus karnatakaensis]|uniref:glycoside hydrolase family 75 protein n=1 Tax=Aspergillus karnatakaensis TaxID=1810916 RepID=UPI003CCCA2B1